MHNPPSFSYYSELLRGKFASLQARCDVEPDSVVKKLITIECERFSKWASSVDLSGLKTGMPLEDRIDIYSQTWEFKCRLERISDIVYTLDEYLKRGKLPKLECRLNLDDERSLNGKNVSNAEKFRRRISKLCVDIDHIYEHTSSIEFEVKRLVQLPSDEGRYSYIGKKG